MDKLKWDSNSEYMREFFHLNSTYVDLIDEIAFVLKNRLKKENIEVAHIEKRVKSPESFLEKIDRKQYKDPIKEITDVAGVRLVYLYLDDFNKIDQIIKKAFIVIEQEEKESKGEDSFGYLAKHYIVKVRKPVSGERYQLLKKTKCEIQVRTVIQDSWAILNHHLMYKREQEIPKVLIRRINQLAAILENADQQFNDIEEKRNEYYLKLSKATTPLEEILNENTNIDSVLAFLKRKFPKMLTIPDSHHLANVFEQLDLEKYSTIRQLNSALDNTKEHRRFYKDRKSNNSLAHLALALGCTDKIYRENTSFGKEAKEVIKSFLSSNDSIKDQ